MRSILIFLTLIIGMSGSHAQTFARARSPQKMRKGALVRRETRKTFNEILAGLKRLKTKYPQLAEVERAVITESQLSYQYGRVQCQSKAQPCSFSENACRVTINLEHISRREDADLHAAVSLLFELGDGTFLDVFFGVLAEPTATGKAFENAANRIIGASLKNLRARLAPHRAR